MEKKNEGQPAADEPRWTVQDVAKYLKMSPAWVYQRVASGEIPFVPMGAYKRFDPEVIRRYARGEPVAPPKVVMLKISK